MNVTNKQNNKEFLQLLGASSTAYGRAKRFMGLRVTVSILFTTIGTLIAYQYPTWKELITLGSAIWAFFSFIVFKRLENLFITKGANIQEMFDTGLFKLNWNSHLAGEKMSNEEIISLNLLFKGNRDNHKNWYHNPGNVSYPTDVILCQRSTVVWDENLRKYYKYFVLSLICLWFIFLVCLSVYLKLSAYEFFIIMFIPCLPAIAIGFEITYEHNKFIIERDRIYRKISNFLTKAERTKKAVTIKDCREIQNELYRIRCEGALVPNWFYFLFRNSFEFNMRKAVKELSKDLK